MASRDHYTSRNSRRNSRRINRACKVLNVTQTTKMLVRMTRGILLMRRLRAKEPTLDDEESMETRVGR